MRLDLAVPGDAPLGSRARLPHAQRTQRRGLPATLRLGAGMAGDVATMVVVAFCIPFVILAIGLPVALCVNLLLWAARAL